MSDAEYRGDKDERRLCTTCVLCWREDYGYSNYTTEGTYLHCLADLNPALDAKEEPWRDVSPELAAALDVALACPRYRRGVPACTDTDTEGVAYNVPATAETVKAAQYTDDDEAATLLATRLGAQP